MNYLKNLSLIALAAILFVSNPFFSAAQTPVALSQDEEDGGEEPVNYSSEAFKWNQDKDEVFKSAKEQDKFILLFVGRTTCGACQDMSELFCNPENPFKQILNDNYVTM